MSLRRHSERFPLLERGRRWGDKRMCWAMWRFSTGDEGWPRSRGPLMEMDINIDNGLYEISLVDGSVMFVRVKKCKGTDIKVLLPLWRWRQGWAVYTPVNVSKKVWDSRSYFEQSWNLVSCTWPGLEISWRITGESVSNVDSIASDRKKLKNTLNKIYVTTFIYSSIKLMLKFWYSYVVIEVLLWSLHYSQWSRKQMHRLEEEKEGVKLMILSLFMKSVFLSIYFTFSPHPPQLKSFYIKVLQTFWYIYFE